MRSARSIALAVLAATLLPACGGSDENTTNAVDFVSLTIYGATTRYSDDAPGVSIMAYSSGGGTAVALSGTGVTFTLALPAGVTGSAVAGTVSTVVGGLSCSGAVTVNVTRHGTSLGGEVAGTFGPTSVNCPIGPSPSTISASFSATHL